MLVTKQIAIHLIFQFTEKGHKSQSICVILQEEYICSIIPAIHSRNDIYKKLANMGVVTMLVQHSMKIVSSKYDQN